MFKIPRRYGHFLFGIVQSGITSGIATLVAGWPSFKIAPLFLHWLVSWAVMVPFVVLAAPTIHKAVQSLTRDDSLI
jgi:hypothetical protein